ncbi:MAG: trypsin-like peptidase domain-containing protein [Planctomycetaceae bacterium]
MTRLLQTITLGAFLLNSVCATLSAQDGSVPDDVLASQAKRIAAIKKASAATVMVFANEGKGGGSGVLISKDGYALSNYHVVQPAGTAMKCAINDGKLYDAVLVSIDPVGDVALIKLLGRNDFPVATLEDSDKVRAGDWCFAVGNPFLLATDFNPTVTYGIVSGVHRYQYPAGTLLEYADCIQTDASINPGNSGGPLFNENGDLIGINGRGSFEKRGRVNVGVGYAISINQIKHFMGFLYSGRILDHATLGATVSTDENGNVIVTNISEASDAYRRGLRYGDQLLSFGGRNITTVNGFKNVLGIYPRGWRVPISFLHEGDRIDTFVRLTGVHSPEELLARVQPNRQQPQGAPMPEGAPKDSPAEPTERNLPDVVKPYFAARRGFANFHFNKSNQARIWNSYTSQTKPDEIRGDWTLRGKLGNLGDASIVLTKTRVDADLPQGKAFAVLDNDLGQQEAPRGSGGLLVALHLWKHIQQSGLGQFGDVYYLGSMPTPKHTEKQDVLVATHSVIECRFYFSPSTGLLTSMEMYPDLGVDPCEIYFSEYESVNGRMLPRHMEIIHGDTIYGDLLIEDFELNDTGATE